MGVPKVETFGLIASPYTNFVVNEPTQTMKGLTLQPQLSFINDSQVMKIMDGETTWDLVPHIERNKP